MTGRAASIAFGIVFAVVTVMTLVWLTVGALVSTPLNESSGQAVVDYLASAVNLVVAVVLLRLGGSAWPTRLLALAMVGSAGAFNLQAHAATLAVRDATGLEIGELHQVLLHGIAGAAYAGALLLVTGIPSRRRVLVGVVGAALFVAGFGTALLPHTVSCVVFFGFGVPLLGVLAVGPAVRRGPTPEARARARLLTSVLVAALGAAVVLALLTGVLALFGRPGLTLDDPTARHGGLGADLPLALLFWFARITAAVLALAVLAADRARSAERGLHRVLGALLAVVAVGGLAVLASTLVGALLGPAAGWVAAAVVAAGVWLPVAGAADRLAERLLSGRRATPAGVLAQVSAFARDDTSIEGVPEALGRALGARAVRLTVHRDGMRDRVLTWRDVGAGEPAVEVAVRHGGAQIGTLAVDPEALAGSGDRQRLVAEVADGLGPVLAAHRAEIELERQLRAATAHAERIAASRRALVAEMDAERRGIERNLHDGAQLHLVSLRLTLGLAEHHAGAGRLDGTREQLTRLAEQLDTAEAVLAETVTGVSSATLAEQGLVATLRADLADAGDVTVLADGIRRHDEAVEAAAYFVCLEAVNNARKHAAGAPIRVRLGERDGVLHLEVADDGPGFVVSAGGPGRGMRNLSARLARVGGHVTVTSAPGEGTVVRGEIPLHEAAPVAPEPATGLTAFVRQAGAAAHDEQQARDARVAAGARALIEDVRSQRGRTAPPPAPRPPVAEDTRLLAVVPTLGAGPELPSTSVPAPLPPSGSGLFDATQALFRQAVEEVPVGHPAAETVQGLAARLAAPWRIGVTGPTAADARAVAGTLSGLVEKPCAVVDLAGRAALGPLAPAEIVDVLVLLAEDDEGTRVPDWLAAVPTVGARVVPPVSVSADDPLTGIVRVALPGAGATGGKNLGRLAGLVVAHGRPAAARRRALDALAAADELLARDPDRPWTRWLAGEVERVRAGGAQELAEAALAADLDAGRVALPVARREAAVRLLTGPEPRVRLGLEVGADAAEVARAAREQHAVWQRLAAHPGAARDVRAAAAVLAAACEALPTREPSGR
ncbi:ATP-binding protein [Actinomycetospora termitidis]|uniref:histidine kinase n=1 Tax=Actinomycetospora termitidis TaxID=3053470 RepID=A0ABT7MB29_9PSEU|nr:ATP-binding protein [Actinomycetospora sp. Odt1-22]MDL5156628.1 histidine kinase [Actinomycetospora sp. Odt1-22]